MIVEPSKQYLHKRNLPLPQLPLSTPSPINLIFPDSPVGLFSIHFPTRRRHALCCPQQASRKIFDKLISLKWKGLISPQLPCQLVIECLLGARHVQRVADMHKLI